MSDIPDQQLVDELESQNQALQEELRKYQPGQGEGWPDDRHEFAGRLTALREAAEALQEALQRALDRYDREDNGTLKVRDGLAWAMAQDLRDALSPTQETDPETCGSCDAEQAEYGRPCWNHDPARTQETDPE